MADDIVLRLRHAAVGLPQDDMNQTAADEIVRLRAEVERLTNGNNVMGLLWNAERALADQLAVALLGTASGRIIPTDDEWAGVVKMRSAALDAWEARRG